MSCITYNSSNCVVSDMKLSSSDGTPYSYNNSCVSDFIDIHNSSISIDTKSNVSQICFYKYD